MNDLAGRSIRSAFLQITGQSAQIVLMLVSAILLARLLTPEDFGLFAMALSLILFVGSFRGFGLPLAALQARTLEPERADALFWLNLKLTAGSTLFVALMAPVLAWFYGEDRLIGILLVAAVGLFAQGVISQHEAHLMRIMRFGGIAASEVGALLVGLVAAVAAALLGWGYWALVLQMLAYSLVKSSLVVLLARWRPAVVRRPLELGELLAFGRNYTGFHILSSAGQNLARILVGYFHGPAALGLYENSLRWSHHPVQNAFPPLLRVAVAGLSRLQEDAAAYASATRRALLPLFSVVVPALVYVALEAQIVIPTLFGEQWTGAVPIFRVLCVAAIASSLTKATAWLYLSRGDTKRQLQWALVSTPVLGLGAVLGVPWGAFGVAMGFTVATCALTYPGLVFCLARSPLSVRDFLGTFSRPALASTAGAVALGACRIATDFGPPACALLFVAVYLACWTGLPGGRREWAEIAEAARLLRPPARRDPEVATLESP